jgi:hypothetical protein
MTRKYDRKFVKPTPRCFVSIICYFASTEWSSDSINMGSKEAVQGPHLICVDLHGKDSVTKIAANLRLRVMTQSSTAFRDP